MTIWILALLFLSCSAIAGFCFGAIRTACSLIGLLLGTVLAFPLAHFLTSVVGMVGIKNPLLVWATGPILVFCLVLIVFKIVGLVVHRKVSLYYKYKAGDLRNGLWNRMNVRVGLCLGLINGAIYAVLISLLVVIPGYATTQLVIGDSASWPIKTVNLLGRDAQASGMDKIVAGLDPTPEDYYTAADLAGLIYHNDLLEARLGRYPAFMTLGERPEFQAFAEDKSYLEMRQRQAPVMEIIGHPLAQAIVGNPDLLKELWGIIAPNMQDLDGFLRTGISPKFAGEKIVGRWGFNVNGALGVLKASRPNLTPTEMSRLKTAVVLAFAKTTMLAAPGGEIFVKDYGTITYPAAAAPGAAPTPAPGAGNRGARAGGGGGAPGAPGPARGAAPGAVPRPTAAPPTVTLNKLDGHWTQSGGNYQINLNGKPAMTAVVEGEKLTIAGDSLPLMFDREY